MDDYTYLITTIGAQDINISLYDLYVNNIYANGNITILGNILNVTTYNVNVTGDIHATGVISGNNSQWNRTGTSVILSHKNDNVGIGTSNPTQKTEIVNIDTSNALKIDQNADSGSSTSTGGALLIENTGNVGAGLVIYSNIGATASGRLLNIRADNSAFDQAGLHIDYDGNANALEVVHNGQDSSAQAFNVVSYNTQDSAFTITSYATGKGAQKMVHVGNSTTTSASAISIDLQNDGTSNTSAQGIYLDATEGKTTGDLLTLRNFGDYVLNVNATGGMGVNMHNPTQVLDVNGSTKIRENAYITGNVGIGTTSPNNKLDVVGSMNVTDNLIVSNVTNQYNPNTGVYFCSDGGMVIGNYTDAEANGDGC